MGKQSTLHLYIIKTKENPMGTFITILILSLIITLAINSIIKDKKSGKGCGGGCCKGCRGCGYHMEENKSNAQGQTSQL
jgi:hypothetical protein